MTDTILSKIVRYFHYTCMLVLIIGVFLPPKYLISYLCLLPAIYIHWYFNDNKCMFVELESQLDNKNLNINNHEEVRHYQFENIFKTLKNFNIRVYHGDSFMSALLNISMVCWVIGFIRLVVYYRKNILNTLSIFTPPLSKRVIHDKYK